jgi:Homeodomain-like domain
MGGATTRSRRACITRREIVSLWRKRFFEERLSGLEDQARPGRPRSFPPDVVVQVKALACELPATLGAPLSRFSVANVAQARQFGLVASISERLRSGVRAGHGEGRSSVTPWLADGMNDHGLKSTGGCAVSR